MGKILKHADAIEDLARRKQIPATVSIAKSKHGRYVKVETSAENARMWENALGFAEDIRRYTVQNKAHAALDIRIPGSNKTYILHIPSNHEKGPYRLPKIKGITLHHGSRAEQPGKVAIAIPLAEAGRRVFDDVGILLERPDGEMEVKTDFDVLNVKHGPNGTEIHIGEVLTDHYDRI